MANVADLPDDDLIQECRKLAGSLSYFRAGWDYYANPPSVKEKERRGEERAYAALREHALVAHDRGLDWMAGQTYLFSRDEIERWVEQRDG